MEVFGAWPAKAVVEKDVFRGGAGPLISADDVGDIHEMVIDDVGEVVGGKSVGLEEDLVIDIGPRMGEPTLDLVVVAALSGEGDLEADGKGLPFSGFDFGFGEVAVASIVAASLPELAHLSQLF